MFKKLFPQQDCFFKNFQQIADILHAAAGEFNTAIASVEKRQAAVDAIVHYEVQGDQITHDTFDTLNKTFITPFDRHDIHQLTGCLDDALDLINRCAQRLPHYQLVEAPNPLLKLSELTLQSTNLVRSLISLLQSLHLSEQIFKMCKDIEVIEDQAHIFVIAGETDLFQNENDFKEFYKLNDLYARTKLIINRCRDVANIVKGITLEYS